MVALIHRNKYFSYFKELSSEYPGTSKSLILHLAIVIFLSGVMPQCSRKIEPPKIIAVDIMPMGQEQQTQPKPQVQQPKPEAKIEPLKPLPPKEVKKPVEATKMEKAEKPKPVAKPVAKPAPKKVETKPKPEPEKKTVDKTKQDDRDQQGQKKLLKDLEKKEQQQLDDIFSEVSKDEPKAQTASASGKSQTIDAAFVNELMGKIQSQVSQYWNIPVGVKDAEGVAVSLYIALARDGAVTQVKIIDQIRYGTDNIYRVMADSAVWAVKEASPLQGLPIDKYDAWKEIEFNFDPSRML